MQPYLFLQLALVIEINNYDYRYVVKDFLAKGADRASLTLLLGQYFLLFLAGVYKQHSLNVVMQTIIYALQVAYNLTYMPFKNWRIQRAQVSRNLVNFALFLFLLLDIYSSQTDFVLIALVIVPMASELGASFYQNRIDHIVDKFFTEAQRDSLEEMEDYSYFSTKKVFTISNTSYQSRFNSQNVSGSINNHEIDVFLRFLQENLSCDYDSYVNDLQSPYLEEIIILHKIHCHQEQFCFCNKTYYYEDSSRKEFLGKEVRQQFLSWFIMHEYKKRMIGGGSGERGINELNFSFWCFLIDIMENQTMSFVETIKVKNCRKKLQLSNKEGQNLETVYQHALTKFGRFSISVSVPGKSQKVQLLDNAMFDSDLVSSQLLYYECLQDQISLMMYLQQDFLDLKQLEKKCKKVMKNKRILFEQLDHLLSVNPASTLLQILQEEFELSLSNDHKLSKKYQHITANPKQAVNCSYLYEYSKEACAIFISLLSNLGQIIKVSNNFEQVVPLYQNEDAIGKNINFMMPSQIGIVHDQILKNFIQKEEMFQGLTDFPILIGIDLLGWSIPYMMKLQVSQISDNEIGVTAWVKQIKDKNLYLTINGKSPHNIQVISQQFYQLILKDIFNRNELQNVPLKNIIPILDSIVSKEPNGVTFETIIIKPKSKQDCVTNLIDLNKRGQPNIFINIAQYDIFIFKGTFYFIVNKFISFVEICITDIQPVVSLLQLKDAIRLLATQLSEIADKDKDLISEQLEKFQDFFQVQDNGSDATINNQNKQHPLQRTNSFSVQSAKLKRKTVDKQEDLFDSQLDEQMKDIEKNMNDRQNTAPSQQFFPSQITDRQLNLSKFNSNHNNQNNNYNSGQKFFDTQISLATENQPFDTPLPLIPTFSTLKNNGSQQGINQHNTTATNAQNTSIYEAINLISPRIIQLPSTREICLTSPKDKNVNNQTLESPNYQRERVKSKEKIETQNIHMKEIGKQKSFMDSKFKLTQKITSQFKLFQNATNLIQQEEQILTDKDQSITIFDDEQEFYKANYNNDFNNSKEKKKHQEGKKNQSFIVLPIVSQRNLKTNIGSSSKNINPSSKEIDIAKKLSFIKQQKMVEKRRKEDFPAENSVQSANTHRSSPKIQLMRTIQRKRKYITLKVSNTFSATFLFLLLVLNQYHYSSTYNYLNDQRSNSLYAFDAISILEIINNIMSDYTTQFLATKSMLQYNSSQSEQQLQNLIDSEKILSKDLLSSIYKNWIDLNMNFHPTSHLIFQEQIQFKLISDYSIFEKKILTSFSQTKYYSLTASVGYSINVMLAKILRYNQIGTNINDYELQYFQNNHKSLSQQLNDINTKQKEKFNDDFSLQNTDEIEQLIESIFIALFFIFLVAITCSQIQQRRERILRLYSTVPSEDIQQSIIQLQASVERATPKQQEILERHRRLMKNSNQQDNTFQNSIQLKKLISSTNNYKAPKIKTYESFPSQLSKKKRSISQTSTLTKIAPSIIIYLFLAFFFLQCYTVANLINQNVFLVTLKKLRTIKGSIFHRFIIQNKIIIVCLGTFTEKKMKVSESIQSMITFIQLYMNKDQINQEFLEYFQSLSEVNISSSSNLLSDLYDCQTQFVNVQDLYGVPQDDYINSILQSGICQAIQQNTNFLPSTSFLDDFNYCEQTFDYSLSSGLIKSLKFLFSTLTSISEILNMSKTVDEFKINQLSLNQNVNIMDVYIFKRTSTDVLSTLINYIENIIQQLHDISFLINSLTTVIQAIIILIIIVIVWKLLSKQIDSTLHETQLLLDVVDISLLLNNSYVLSYFKSS